ncbi:MAG TPA: protein-glutamate O-methyltransferase CheR [Verrucomicrobiae bacterium]|jgi:chemotaxis protein methyltransferase CheR|nr:protein-glutamate O-methyltransferase CheR [Verrucomicrobiae bacterium]
MSAATAEAEACKYIIHFIYERCRIRLHAGKEALIKARLGKRIRHLGFSTLAEYCDFLRTRGDDEEFTRVVDALTTNFTNFMREEEHFKFLVEKALPAMLRPGEKKFHVWSAASSSGEEAYTAAFYLAEHYTLAQGWDWCITASDISTKVLERARLGLYVEDRLSAVPQEWRRKYFQKGTGQWAGYYRIKRSLSERVNFEQINLIEDYHHAQPFEIIFCRNVMIYFDRATQEQLVNRLCRFLVPGGYLFIGHSESLNGLNVPLRCLRPSIYQRNSS